MSRDSDDDVPVLKPARKGFPVWGWFLIGGAVLLLVCGGIAVAGALAYWGGAATSAARQADPKTKVWKEEELSAAVKGKTPAEVKALLGVPDEAVGDPLIKSNDTTVFIYHRRIENPHSGEITSSWVAFRDGKATGKVR